MLSFLKKWLFPSAMDKPALRWRSAMEDMLMTERKIIRRKRALKRFKVMTYEQWVTEKRSNIRDRESEIMYAEYVARKDVERKALEAKPT